MTEQQAEKMAEAIAEQMQGLTEQDRQAVMVAMSRKVCIYCGRVEMPCFCRND